MDARGIQPPAAGDRKGKRAGRRARGLQLFERDGYWHAHGTLRAGGRSVRVRKSLGMAVAAVSQTEAEATLDDYVGELTARITGKVGRGDPVAVIAAAYLGLPRQRPLGPASIRIIQRVVRRFGVDRANEIPPGDWIKWIDDETEGLAPASRERLLGTVVALLNFAKRKHGLVALPDFIRDRAARNPNQRKRRRIEDLRPELVQALFDAAHISIRAQLAVERCTGARVSSVIYAARVCDLILAEGREQITFPQTKNGQDVTAALDATAVTVLKDYLKWRGKLHEREAPLFLTYRRKPYTFNGRVSGGQNKTGFGAAKRRAAKALIAAGEARSAELLAKGQAKAAQAAADEAKADAELIGKVTQHWFRHMLATKLLRRDARTAMEQGGWLDVRSVMGYSHDAPEYRRRLVREMDDLSADSGTNLTRDLGEKPKKARR